MTYGLQVTGNNDVFQIDSDIGTAGIQVIAAGSASSISSFFEFTDMIYVRKQTTQANICAHISGGAITFRVGTTGTAVAVEYIHTRAVGSITVSGNYGLQVYGPSSIAFDSRGFTANTGVTIINSVAKNTLSNGGVIDTDLTNYILFNWSYYTNTSNFAGMTSSTTLNRYSYVMRVGGSYTGTNLSEIPIAQAFTS